MVRDAYANYVVQTAIDVVPEGNEKRMMLDELKNHEVQLVRVKYCSVLRATLTPCLLTHVFSLNSETTLLQNISWQSYPLLNECVILTNRCRI